MLVIRMQRVGRAKQPYFRLIIQEKTKSPRSTAVEIVGFYNPRTKEKNFKEDRITYWMGQGAQATDAVNNLLVGAGVIKAEKRRVVSITGARKGRMAEAVKADAETKAKAEEKAAVAKAAAEETAKGEAEAAKVAAEAPVVEAPTEPEAAPVTELEAPAEEPKEDATPSDSSTT